MTSAELSTEVIDSPEGLEDIRPKWQRLYECCPWAAPFQSPDWLIPWWTHIGTGRLRTIAAYADGELLGLAPLYLHGREALFLGTGVSDYLDFLAQPESGRQTAELFIECLMTSPEDCEVCRLHEIRADSPLLALRLARFGRSSSPLSVCPVIELPRGSDEYLAQLPLPLRRSIRRSMKKMHPYRVEKAGPQTVPEFMEKLFLLHASRWKERNLPGVLDESQVQSFHREVAKLFASKGRLGLYGLWYQDRLAAVIYSFQKDRRVYAYLSGFDPELEEFSPGALLMYHVIESSIQEGFREFDFLRGSESYKYLWGAKDTQTFLLEFSKSQ